jgi:transposase
VIVANAREVHYITRSTRKSDRMDAEALARLARVDSDLLHPVQHRGEGVQRDRAVLRARDALVRARTLLINNVRGLTKTAGSRLPECSADAFHRRIPEAVPPELLPALGPLLEAVGALTERIREYDRQVQAMLARYEETRLLLQPRGVGPLTALTYVLTIEDPGRFSRSRMVGAYVGLVPGRRQSGDRDPQLHITRAGDRMLRRLLVECARSTCSAPSARTRTSVAGGYASPARAHADANAAQ